MFSLSQENCTQDLFRFFFKDTATKKQNSYHWYPGVRNSHLCSLGLFIPRGYKDTELSVSYRNGCGSHKYTPDSWKPLISLLYSLSGSCWVESKLQFPLRSSYTQTTIKTSKSSRNGSGHCKPMTKISLIQYWDFSFNQPSENNVPLWQWHRATEVQSYLPLCPP